VLPDDKAVAIDRATWTPPPVFDLVRRVGEVAQPALEATLNCGVGMVALTAPEDADRAVALLAGHGVEAWVCGEVVDPAAGGLAAGTVSLHGQHPGW
jgi:phosphoribosylformylglycinamidine cyclo-ligase